MLTNQKIYHRNIKALKHEMRIHPTPAEYLLWQQIRHKQLGIRFRRQFSFGRYIVDFYAYEAKLVIEIDGSVHDSEEQKIYDAQRTEYLSLRGLTIIRFTNDEIINNITSILEVIRNHIHKTPCSRSEKGAGGKAQPWSRANVIQSLPQSS